MDELTAHEKFLRGEPLSDELRAMREGEIPNAGKEAARGAPTRTFDHPERELTRAERLDLKEWMEMPGWELFRRIIEKANLMHQKHAIASSQQDPLSRQNEISSVWAYEGMFRRSMIEIQAVVMAELAELEKTQ